ncbi:MAG: hypothetical protein WC465_03495 [Patescibacteria group bacterium]
MANHIIIDVPGVSRKWQNSFSSFDLELVWAEDLTKNLLGWEAWRRFSPQDTLLVLPGNGASIVKSYLPDGWLDRWHNISIYAKRYWSDKGPIVECRKIVYSERFYIGIANIVVLDDVVSSGLTIRGVRLADYPMVATLANVRWHSASWLAQNSARFRGFNSFFAVRWCGSPERKDPINSLSTLLADERVSKNYAKRNFSIRGQEFLEIIDQLRSTLVGV